MSDKTSGIYKIQSVIKPERIYIGSAKNIHDRWLGHLSNLRNGKHHSPKLQNHFNKYGKDDFIFSIITGCLIEELIEKEQFFIDVYKPYFNLCPTAGSLLGVKRTEETKRKISESNKGQKPTAYTLQRGKEVNTGSKHTEEHKRKISEALKGKPGVKGRPSPMAGKHHTPEALKKISESSKLKKTFLGKKHTPETIEKMRAVKIGKKQSEATKQKIGEQSKGRHMSEAARQKIREARLEYWGRKRKNKAA